MEKTLTNQSVSSDSQMLSKVNRRFFLRSAGVAATTGAFILGACTEQDLEGDDTVNLGSGDIGILNYAYALEQLEAAFYIQVMTTPYINMTDEEKWILTDIRDHEIVHREFFKKALGDAAIKGLTPNFASIDFQSRESVLKSAMLFEDTGVAAYNGAGKLISDAKYLLVAGKIVSVEARHASAIADLLNPNALEFANGQINEMGLEHAYSPSVILAGVQPFVMNKISGNMLPR
jgi:rubrerythrin